MALTAQVALPASPTRTPERVIVGHPVSPLDEPRYAVFYSPELAQTISDLSVSESLLKISARPGMPSYGTLLRWAKDKPEFLEMLRGARAVKALHHEEQAVAVATEMKRDKDDVPQARLAFEAHKWASEVADPATYGKRTTIQGDAKNPVVFKVMTGMPDPLPHQQDPKLGADGLVTQERPKEVLEPLAQVIEEAVVLDEAAPTPEENGDLA